MGQEHADGAVPSPSEAGGKWKVVAPDGTVRAFKTQREMLEALAQQEEVEDAPAPPVAAAEAVVEEPAPVSMELMDLLEPGADSEPAGSAEPRRLSLVPFDEPPPLPEKPKAAVETFPFDDPPNSSDLVPDSSSRPETLAAREGELDEGELLSARDIVVDPSVRTAVAAARAQEKADEPDDSSSPEMRAAPDSDPPPPPKKGTLKTLPPPPRRDAPAPPPPTINVASTPPPPEAKASAPPTASTAKPATAAAASPKRSWLMPFIALALVTAIAMYFARGTPGPTGVPTPQLPTQATTAALTETAPTAAISAVQAAPSTRGTTPSASIASASGSPESSSSLAPSLPPGSGGARLEDTQLPLPQLLERAAAARRSGDAARSRALLERALAINPGNAEAHAGLGELARSQGDMNGAKKNYENAIATSPRYTPALLALADIQWDLGERDAAQRRYQEILSYMPTAPERVKERAGGPPAPVTPASIPGSPAPDPPPQEEP